MKKQVPIATARANLASLIEEAEAGHKIELTRRGKPVAVLLSRQEYSRLGQVRPRFGDLLREFRRSADPAVLRSLEDALTNLRDRGPGRPVDL